MVSVADRLDAGNVTDRLAWELREAAEAARHDGQPELARNLDDRVEVFRWASSLQRRTLVDH